MYFIGYDIGSSSIKASLVESATGKCIDIISKPEKEMEITASEPNWAEQDPELWWQYVCQATQSILANNKISSEKIKGVGIAYQMHGLVLVDKEGSALRNSIIWCDGRAVEIGSKALKNIGSEKCMQRLLNSPANFTASKLKWVKDQEPNIYKNIYKFMLPGDYIAYRFSNKINTTLSGLSEGIFWDFKEAKIAHWLLDHFGLDQDHIPEIVPTFSKQSIVSNEGAKASGLLEGTPICYRAGDQPNNALSLNVMQPGEVAATGGTSGVFYAVTESYIANENSGVNNFAHVNHKNSEPRIGKLMCINGAGIQYRWLLNNIDVGSYEEMNQLAAQIPIGSEGIAILPFGNGPERIFNNQSPGASIHGLNFNLHSKSHLCRAALEGIAFAFVYGMELLRNEGVVTKVVRAGNDNLFRSEIFSQTISNLINHHIEIYDNTGATGAARACIIYETDLKTYGEQIRDQDYLMSYTPNAESKQHRKAYLKWKQVLDKTVNNG